MVKSHSKPLWFDPYFDKLQRCIESRGYILFTKESIERDFPQASESPLTADDIISHRKLRFYKGLRQFYKFYPGGTVAIVSLFPGGRAGPKSNCIVNINVYFSVPRLQELLCRLQNVPYDPRYLVGSGRGLWTPELNDTQLLVNAPYESYNDAMVSKIAHGLTKHLLPSWDEYADEDLVLEGHKLSHNAGSPATAILAYLFQGRFDEGLCFAEKLWAEKVAKFRFMSLTPEETMKQWDSMRSNPRDILTDAFMEKIRKICETKDLNAYSS